MISRRDLCHCSCHQPTGQLHTPVPGGCEERSLSSQPDWAGKGNLEAIPVNVLEETQQWQVCSIMGTDGTGRETLRFFFLFFFFLVKFWKRNPLCVTEAPVLLTLMCSGWESSKGQSCGRLNEEDLCQVSCRAAICLTEHF